MPELPEVETIVRDLALVLPGRRIGEVSFGHPSVFRYPDAQMTVMRLAGRSINLVERRGKYINCVLDDGQSLVVHLGMTGHLLVSDPAQPEAPHTHLRAGLDDGRELRFDDARRFGRILLGELTELVSVGKMPVLGLEPLDKGHDGEYLWNRLHKSNRVLKAALLDQRVLAGLGNIYVDEACHRAGVKPTRRCNRLRRKECDALSKAIVEVLRKAIRNRGTSFDDYRDAWNAKGSNQESLQVYGRGGQPCFRDGAVLKSAVVGGRTTVWCPQCQK